jgi:hypothetical protein
MNVKSVTQHQINLLDDVDRADMIEWTESAGQEAP